MVKFSYKNLLKDSLIFAIGNFGSKIIVFFLVPYYTFYISKEDFGTFDLINTVVNLVFPFITLAIYEATLRYNLEEKYDKKSVFSNSILIFFIGVLVTLTANYMLITSFEEINKELSIITMILILLSAFQKILVQFVRGLKLIKLFVINGVIISLTTSLLSVLLIGIFKMELKGILYSTIISLVVSNLILFRFANLKMYLNIKKINFNLLREMIVYSVPLIPNTLSLWITSSSNRFFILYFLGTSENGLFAVSYKFAAIMTLVNSFFFQAWQIVASEQFESKNRNQIYQSVFNYFSYVMITVGSLLIIVIEPVFNLIVDTSYFHGWKLVPYLVVGAIISSFSSFIGTNYSASKNTSGVFKTTILGAITNVLLCLILIPLLGLYGVCISFLVSYLVIFIARVNDTKRILGTSNSYNRIYIIIFILFLQSSFRLLSINLLMQYLIQISIFIFICYVFRENIKKIKSIIMNLKRRMNNA